MAAAGVNAGSHLHRAGGGGGQRLWVENMYVFTMHIVKHLTISDFIFLLLLCASGRNGAESIVGVQERSAALVEEEMQHLR